MVQNTARLVAVSARFIMDNANGANKKNQLPRIEIMDTQKCPICKSVRIKDLRFCVCGHDFEPKKGDVVDILKELLGLKQ